jgi:hypothetical protein
MGVTECIPQCLSSNSVKIIAQGWVHIPRRAFYQDTELGRRFTSFVIGIFCLEFLTQGSKSLD